MSDDGNHVLNNYFMKGREEERTREGRGENERGEGRE